MNGQHLWGKIEMSNKLFDTSAIINLCNQKEYKHLEQGSTLSLTYYELGNVLWKQVNLQRIFSLDEGVTVLIALTNMLSRMHIIESPRAVSTLRLATQHNLTFYDAAFLDTAIRYNFSLVTDDKKLGQVAKDYVSVTKSNKL